LTLEGRIIHRLNIVERKRWGWLYLRCYLGLANDDRRGVLEDEPLPCHLIMRVEELLQIGAVSLERFAILLRQGVKGGHDDVLVEVRSVGARVSLLHA
jgi:hypothetical protein